MTRDAILRFTLGLCLATLVAACGGGNAKAPAPVTGIEQPHLKVAIISVTATYVPLYLAVDDGLFAKEGLQVELLPFRGGMPQARTSPVS